MHTADDQSQLISLHSEWIDSSQMRVRVRRIGKIDKIVVDVWELTNNGHRTSKARARKVACNAARVNGANSPDATLLLDFETDRKVTRFDGTQDLVRIRQSSFAF